MHGKECGDGISYDTACRIPRVITDLLERGVLEELSQNEKGKYSHTEAQHINTLNQRQIQKL